MYNKMLYIKKITIKFILINKNYNKIQNFLRYFIEYIIEYSIFFMYKYIN